MAKFMNIVRCKVKSSNRDEYLKKIDDMPKFEGQISAKYVETCLLYTSDAADE